MYVCVNCCHFFRQTGGKGNNKENYEGVCRENQTEEALMAVQRVLAGSSEDPKVAQGSRQGSLQGSLRRDHITVLIQNVLVISSGSQRSGREMVSPLVFLTE